MNKKTNFNTKLFWIEVYENMTGWEYFKNNFLLIA